MGIRHVIGDVKPPLTYGESLNIHVIYPSLSTFHDKYVVVPADNAPNNIVLICKKRYIDCLKIKVGWVSLQGNPTYTDTTLSEEEIIDNHMSVVSSFGLSVINEDCDLPLLYWIPKLHKCPYKQR